MKRCEQCGAEYGDDGLFCPYCDERYGRVMRSNDVVSGDFPEYKEDEQRIIGETAENYSFTAHKDEIYRRNNLIVREAALVDRETERRRLEAEKAQVAERKEQLDTYRLNKTVRRVAAVAAALIVSVVTVLAAVNYMMDDVNVYQETMQTEVAVTITQTNAPAAEISEAVTEQAAEIVTEINAEAVEEVPEEQTAAEEVTEVSAVEEVPVVRERLVPRDGEYSADSENISCCFSIMQADSLNSENGFSSPWLRVTMRIQLLDDSGKEMMSNFRINYTNSAYSPSDGQRISKSFSSGVNCLTPLTSGAEGLERKYDGSFSIGGVSGLYEAPFTLSFDDNGYAEYDLYFVPSFNFYGFSEEEMYLDTLSFSGTESRHYLSDTFEVDISDFDMSSYLAKELALQNSDS
ncbi:MAG: hypothetical protein ACI4J6_02090 [Oscillospiraceae bacterium]